MYLYRQWLLEHSLSGEQGGVMRSAILHNLMLAVVGLSFCLVVPTSLAYVANHVPGLTLTKPVKFFRIYLHFSGHHS